MCKCVQLFFVFGSLSRIILHLVCVSHFHCCGSECMQTFQFFLSMLLWGGSLHLLQELSWSLLCGCSLTSTWAVVSVDFSCFLLVLSSWPLHSLPLTAVAPCVSLKEHKHVCLCTKTNIFFAWKQWLMVYFTYTPSQNDNRDPSKSTSSVFISAF